MVVDFFEAIFDTFIALWNTCVIILEECVSLLVIKCCLVISYHRINNMNRVASELSKKYIIHMIPRCANYSDNFFLRVIKNFIVPRFLIPNIFKPIKNKLNLLDLGQFLQMLDQTDLTRSQFLNKWSIVSSTW